ncbi:MAG: hypothetical protein K5657_01615 [Desulfovibrio sp.]|nr:hypothetical protein [Desulfovibrio sp.]
MMTPSYVASAIDGRIRLRHPHLKSREGREEVRAFLKKQKKIRDVVPGSGSLLVYLDPDTKLSTFCNTLEKEFPEWGAGKDDGKLVLSKFDFFGGLSARKVELRFLMGIFALAALLGFTGSDRAHVGISILAAVFTLRHVWTRRTAL